MTDDCIFCKIVRGEIPSERIFESKNFIVVRDAYPKLDGHSLVIPKKHFENFIEMDSELYREMLEVAKNAIGKIGCKEFNLVLNNGKSAGQVIFHVHLHILPRKKGDGFKFGV